MHGAIEHYRLQSLPLIKAAILEVANEPDDLKKQQHIRSKFPWHRSNLVAWKVWEEEVVRLRLHYHKHRNFKDSEPLSGQIL